MIKNEISKKRLILNLLGALMVIFLFASCSVAEEQDKKDKSGKQTEKNKPAQISTASAKKTPLTPEEIAARRCDYLAKELNLDDQNKEKVKSILTDAEKEKRLLQEKIKALNKSSVEQISGVLNEEQRSKFDELVKKQFIEKGFIAKNPKETVTEKNPKQIHDTITELMKSEEIEKDQKKEIANILNTHRQDIRSINKMAMDDFVSILNDDQKKSFSGFIKEQKSKFSNSEIKKEKTNEDKKQKDSSNVKQEILFQLNEKSITQLKNILKLNDDQSKRADEIVKKRNEDAAQAEKISREELKKILSPEQMKKFFEEVKAQRENAKK